MENEKKMKCAWHIENRKNGGVWTGNILSTKWIKERRSQIVQEGGKNSQSKKGEVCQTEARLGKKYDCINSRFK